MVKDNLSLKYPQNPGKILKVEISLSFLKLMYLSEYVANLSELGLKI